MKKLSKKALLSLSALAIIYVSSSFAQDNANKALVYQQAKKYAEVVACNNNFDDKDRPVKLFPLGNEAELIYAVLWIGDKGCFGGAGTSSYILSTFTYAPLTKTFLLAQADVFAEINNDSFSINSRFIESVKAADATTLAVQSLDFAKGDTKPSLQYRYLLRYNKAFNQWQLQSTKLLNTGQNATDIQQVIKDIRKRYQAVNTTISSKGCQSNKSFDSIYYYGTDEEYSALDCPYYHSVLSANQRNKPVSAIGIQRIRTDFWFTDEAGEYRLRKVNRARDIGHPQKISQEYLYDDDNNLIFYYRHDPFYDKYDTRLYFNNGKLIKALPKDFSTDVNAVLRTAKNLVITAEF